MVFSLLTKSYIYSHETLAINGASLVTPPFGGEEAVRILVSLNARYVLISIHFMCQRILRADK
jgi:hypothetical protein